MRPNPTAPRRHFLSVHTILGCLILGTRAVCAQTVLTNGASYDGTLSAGARTSYAFSASAGDKVIVQAAKLSGGAAFTPQLELFGPDGLRLAGDSQALSPRVDIQAAVSGTYTVAISDVAGTGGGNYRLRLALVPGPFEVPAGDEGGGLTNGVVQQGNIELGDLDLWTISAGAGERITVQLAELSGGAGFMPRIELYDPTGTLLGVDAGATAARIDVQTISAGVYTVLVSDAERSGTGTYALQTAHFPGTFVVPAGDEGGPLPDVTDTDGVITVGDFDVWTFDANGGDHVALQLTELSGGASFQPQVELFGPDGAAKGIAKGATGAVLDVAIDANGTYSLLISDADQTGSGSYRLRLTRSAIAPPQADALTNGLTAIGGVAIAGQTNRWSFNASAGESLVVRLGEVTSGAFVPWLRLYSPNGVLLGQDFSPAAAEVAVRATNAGTFLAIVSDGSNGRSQTGNYRINLARTGTVPSVSPNDEGGVLTNGTAYLGTIDVGEVDTWTLTANAGESFVVRVGETTAASVLYPWIRLYGPDGAMLAQSFSPAAVEVTARATNSGRFLVVVADGNNGLGGSGNYRISLAKTGSEPMISPTDEGGPLTDGTTYLGTIETGDIDAWTFTANVGDTFAVRIGETTANSPLYPWLRVYGPNGALLHQDFSPAAAEVTARATNSGRFLVVVGDGNNGIGGTGNYRLSLAKTGAQPMISPGDEGGLLVNGTTYIGSIEVGDIDAWTFTAEPGEAVIVRMGETTANSALYPWLRLYGPNGALLNQDFAPAAAEVTVRATNSGTYLVIVGDGNNGIGGSGNYRLSLARNGAPLFTSPTDEGGPMTSGTEYIGAIDTGDIDSWTFTACAGDVISLSVAESVAGSALYPWMRLYGPDGAILRNGNVFGPSTATIPSFVASTSGTYLLVVSDGNNGLGGSGNYKLTVNGLSDGLKLCPPRIAGTNAVVTGIGGPAASQFTLLSSTEVTTPLALWSRIATNRFSAFGISMVTNTYLPLEPRRFFILQVP